MYVSDEGAVLQTSSTVSMEYLTRGHSNLTVDIFCDPHTLQHPLDIHTGLPQCLDGDHFSLTS